MKRIAFITGSSRGIGRAIALRLAEDGYDIILHGLTFSAALQKTEKELKKLNALTWTTTFDISLRNEVHQACREIFKRVKRVDVLVNNAGSIRDKTFLKMSDKDLDFVIKTSLYGAFHVTKEVLPYMKENKYGRVINISSIVATNGNFGQTNHAAAKAGLIGMTKSLALEVARYNITVNAVCPGFIATDSTATIPQDHLKRILSKIAFGRLGTPREVAHAVSFLAHPDASYITGAVIEVNGGWM